MTHPERSESELAGSRFVGDAGVALFWLLAEQAEEGGRKDELACSARGQTNFHPKRQSASFSAPSCPVLKAGSLARFVWVAGARASSLLAGSAERLAVA